ncbi:MAG: DUF2637 domain-containing protein [Pseudonocardia sp.]|nr:DUF2637 domain-containing protein [Pseudonocardia sp.]
MLKSNPARVWARGEQRGPEAAREPVRWGSWLRLVGSGALLAVVIGAPVAASWHGLSSAGADSFGLAGGWSALVPLVLDAAAAYTAVLAVRDVLSGDSALANRGLTWAYAAASAGINFWHADQVGGVPAALFFAAASLSAVALWDRTLRALRRDQLRAQGAVQAPTPRFRVARWVVAPKETARAWRVAVIEGITEPVDAVRMARQLAETGKGPAALPSADLRGLSTADAVRTALRELGADKPAREVTEWLAERGVQGVTTSYVGDVVRRDRGKGEAVAELPSGEQRLSAAS